jgi:hypothetical protein
MLPMMNTMVQALMKDDMVMICTIQIVSTSVRWNLLFVLAAQHCIGDMQRVHPRMSKERRIVNLNILYKYNQSSNNKQKIFSAKNYSLKITSSFP